MGQREVDRTSAIARLRSIVTELGQTEPTVLFCQIWTAGVGQEQVLKVAAQSFIPARNDVIRTYASLSEMLGIREANMDLIGDCYNKGATRIIEDLEHADGSQHPRNLLPGHSIPACSALFLPVFDLTDPLLRRQTGAVSSPSSPTAVLEILVCETAKVRHNNSDLINIACEMLDKYEFGISADSTAFKEWSKHLPSRQSNLASSSISSVSPVRATLSRAGSTYMLYSDDSDDSTVMYQETSALSSPVGLFGKGLSGIPIKSTNR